MSVVGGRRNFVIHICDFKICDKKAEPYEVQTALKSWSWRRLCKQCAYTLKLLFGSPLNV